MTCVSYGVREQSLTPNLKACYDNIKSFSFILLKFVMHATNKQFLDKFDNGWKHFQNGRLIAIFSILRQ